MQYAYPFKALSEDDGVTVTFPDVPEAIAAGDDLVEALAVAEDVLADALLTYVEKGKDLPHPPVNPRSAKVIAVPAPVAAKLAVWETWKAAEISKSELARRMDIKEGEARRILDPNHATKLPTLERALRALGKKLVVSVEAA